MRRESRIINGLAASITAGVMAPSVVSGQTYYDGAPDYSLVGSITDPNRDTTETVYDGIGTVTPLPGGTSVLERVLYQIDQVNLSSPGAVAPFNSVYANIAESVLQRDWYTTDRLCPSSDNLGHQSGFCFGGSGSSLIEFMRFQFGGASAA